MPAITSEQKLASLPVLPPVRRYHRFRFAIHWTCFLIFVALPFFDVMRFDIPKQRFYFFGQELWINEFAIIFFTLMFLLFAVAAASMLYGRVYCGYLCPQMIFSEASMRVEDRIRRLVNKHFIEWKPALRQWTARIAFYGLLLVASVILAFVFIAYFVEPRDLLRRLASFDLVTAAGVSGAATTLFTFLDLAFVRVKFCTTICPYGYLQGMLSDKQTLLVVYRDGTGKEKACIECKKCVRVCHMGIDIRKSPFQIECIHCGECVEACDEVLARLNKPGLIHYTWGEQGELIGSSQRGWRAFLNRIGFRDFKRVGVAMVLVFYASGLTVALSMRKAVLVRIMPDRAATMYTMSAGGDVVNRFRMTVANRGRQPASVAIGLTGLAGGRILLERNPVALQPGESVQTSFDITAPALSLQPGVNHFELNATSEREQSIETFPHTFIAPARKSP